MKKQPVQLSDCDSNNHTLLHLEVGNHHASVGKSALCVLPRVSHRILKRHVRKGQELKLIIFIASSKLFLREPDIFLFPVCGGAEHKDGASVPHVVCAEPPG